MNKKSGTTLAERLDDVRQRIADACAKANRSASEVTLLAVTKAAAPEQIREILSLGVADLAENRVQQLVQRAAQINEYHARVLARGEPTAQLALPPRIRWHMIGHLQRNKVKQVLPIVSCIHSIDSLRLAEELDIAAGKFNDYSASSGGSAGGSAGGSGGGSGGGPGAAPRKINVLLQVNASEEVQKYGVAVGAAVHLAEQVATMPNLQLVGLMSMAAYDASEAVARFTFARTREIFEEIRWHKFGGEKFRHLSMGMSGDFEAAIQEGATLIRLGTTLFGTPTHESEDAGDE